MRLIIGGSFQGKLEYAQKIIKEENSEFQVLDESCLPELPEIKRMISRMPVGQKKTLIINHLHLIVKQLGSQQRVNEWLEQIRRICTDSHADLIVISDEVGSGLIPLSPEDRCFREDVGRVLCETAGKADRVVRMVCGIPCVIKS